MFWTISFIVSVLILALTIVTVTLKLVKRDIRGKIFTPMNLMIGGAFLALFVVLLPIYMDFPEEGYAAVKAFGISFYNTMLFFTLNGDSGIIADCITPETTSISTIYSLYVTALFSIAPILTFSFLISLLKDTSAFLRYLVHYFGEVYVFSELNEKALTLAEDLRKKHPHAVIVFTNVIAGDSDTSDDMADQAEAINAICFKKDIQTSLLKNHSKKKEITFFIIGDNESENIGQALFLTENYRERDNTSLFLCSTRIDGELLMPKLSAGKVKVRRINEVRSLINRLLYEEGTRLFDNARPVSEEEKKISAVIVGMGQHGIEMMKALSWYCQMDGYSLSINAFDQDPLAEDKFKALCPELMDPKVNGKKLPGESIYDIRIHPGCDVNTKTFADQIKQLEDTTYVLVALGSDDQNIHTAVNLRTLFEQCGIKPVIRAIVYSTAKKEALTGITNYKRQSYDIELIGDIKTSYSEQVIMNLKLESEGLFRHLHYGGSVEEFWQYEYNYRSSIASALHFSAKKHCGLLPEEALAEFDRIQDGVEESEVNAEQEKIQQMFTPKQRDLYQLIEHRRWNAYMRSEGFIYHQSRNDLGKMHFDLVPYEELTDAEKAKDFQFPIKRKTMKR